MIWLLFFTFSVVNSFRCSKYFRGCFIFINISTSQHNIIDHYEMYMQNICNLFVDCNFLFKNLKNGESIWMKWWWNGWSLIIEFSCNAISISICPKVLFLVSTKNIFQNFHKFYCVDRNLTITYFCKLCWNVILFHALLFFFLYAFTT